MRLSNNKKLGVYLSYENFKSSKEAVQKLFTEAKRFGVNFPDYFDGNQLI